MELGALRKVLENKIAQKNVIEKVKHRNFIGLKKLEKELCEKKDLFENYTVSLSKNMLDVEIDKKSESFHMIQKIYGSKVRKT